MNDLTKQELETIKYAISELLVIDGEDSEKSLLYAKITAMIDNYCENENSCKKELTKITDSHQSQ